MHPQRASRTTIPTRRPVSTYYAFTEVFGERGMEMLLAVASDDDAKVWLNDQLFWRNDGTGPWRIEEGFRKVLFRRGFNTLLVPAENAPTTCTYSIHLCPPVILL